MGDFGSLFQFEKNKNYIMRLYNNDEDSFFEDLFNYMNCMINNRDLMFLETVDIFCKYISFFELSDHYLCELDIMSKRCSELKNSLCKNQKRIYDSLCIRIQDYLNECSFDSDKKKLELVFLGNTINDIIDNSNPVIFELLNNSDIVKFKFHDGELLIDRVYRKFSKLLQDNRFYKDRLEYLKQVIFTILSFNKKSNKIDKILVDLDSIKKSLNSREQNNILMGLKNELCLLKNGSLPDKSRSKSLRVIERYYDIHPNFPESVKNIKLSSSRYNGVIKIGDYETENNCIKDFRDKRIITIDSHFKSAYDDAISIEKTDYGYLFGIYITDVSSFVKYDGELGNCALERCESIYFSENNNHTVFMFPKDLSKDFFSLNSGCDKQVVAYLFKFSDNYDLIGREFTNAIINVNNNYTFDDIDKISMNDSNYDMIYDLKKITEKLSGEYNCGYHKVKEKFKGNKSLGVGSNIISSSSIFLNSYIASLFFENNYPLIYRVNDSFVSSSISNLNVNKIIKNYSIPSYSSSPGEHVINGGVYCHITNPIRNYPSFINQHLFENLFLDWHDYSFRKKFIDYWNSYLPDLVQNINRKMSMNDNYVKVINSIKN